MVILDDGALIGRYRARSLIFRTPLFDVYSATEDRGSAVCALRSEHGRRPIPADPEFNAELEKLRALRLSRFPRVLDGGRDDQSAWLITEAIGGTSPIWTPGADPVHWLRAVVTLGRSIAESFGKAAEAGIYHGVLAPDCLRKWPNGSASIVGLGAARLFGLDTETLRASPRYCAPEQLQEAAVPTSERTDVYALGMCLYAFIMGREPFDGAAGLPLRSLAEYGSPDFSLLRNNPDKLSELLVRCCAKRAVERLDWSEFAEWAVIIVTLCQIEAPEAVRTEILFELANQLDPDTLGKLIERSSQNADQGDEVESTDRTPLAGSVAGPLIVPIAAPMLIASAPSNEASAPATDRVPVPPPSPPKEPSRDVAAAPPDEQPLEPPAAPPLKGRRRRGRAPGAVAVLGGVCLCLSLALVMMSNSGPPATSPPPARPALTPAPDEGPGPLPIGKRAAEGSGPPSAEPAPRVSRPSPAIPRGAVSGDSLRGSCGTWFNCEPLSEESK